MRSQLYVALDQEYMTRDVFDELYAKALQVSRMIAGLMGYLRPWIQGNEIQKAALANMII